MSLDRDQVRGYIEEAARNLKEEIKKDLEGKFLYLKFDGCTRLQVNYLGLNARYVGSNGEPVTKVLAVVDTMSRHTGKETKDIICKILVEYSIPLDKVVCCVTDNAANMLKTVELINKEVVLADEEGEDEDDKEDDVDESQLDLEVTVPPSVDHMRCAVHTLQLAVRDGIRETAKPILTKLRAVAKEARSPKINEQLKWRMGLVAILDQETCWGSSYLMVDRIIELRPCLQDMADTGNKILSMTDSEWEESIALRDILKKAFIITKALQFEDLTLGYFYKKWSGLRVYYQEHDSNLANSIAKSMEKREKDLLENGILLAAVLVDINHMDLLPERYVEIGKQSLIQLVWRMKGMGEEDEASKDDNAMSTPDETDSDPDIQLARKKSKVNPIQQNPFILDEFDEEELTLSPPPHIDDER